MLGVTQVPSAQAFNRTHTAESNLDLARHCEKVRYERFVAFLGSLGSNAPFIGLLGTVIGIMGAFADLRNIVGEGSANRSEAIMGSISEALVATAVGLIVAIPAVVAYNALKVQIKKAQTDTASLAAVLLAHLKSTSDKDSDAAG